MFSILNLFCLLVAFATTANAAFGYTQNGTIISIDTGATPSLTFTLNTTSGDILTQVFNGINYQSTTQKTQANTGLNANPPFTGVVTCTPSYQGASNQYVKIACDVSDGSTTVYYVFQSGVAAMYGGLYRNTPPSSGELRFTARYNPSLIQGGFWVAASYNNPSEKPVYGTVIEGNDVYLVLNSAGVNETRSQYYSSERFIDDPAHSVFANDGSVRVTMVLPGNAYESSTGGPFMRDLDYNNNGQQGTTNLFFYTYSSHVSTEAPRIGLGGPYGIYFTTGATVDPNQDLSFFENIGTVRGLVPRASRGSVSGTVTGFNTGNKTLHWFNDGYQYWVRPSSTGAYTSPLMVPGTYQMVLYQGVVNNVNYQGLANGGPNHNTLWLIGIYDGRPNEFQNGGNSGQLRMHPSDARQTAYMPRTFAIGTSYTQFPLCQIYSVNSPTTITFTLTAAQAVGVAILRVGTTLSYNTGRPLVTINGAVQPDPGAPKLINSRGFTRGAYRGYGDVYDFYLSDGALNVGANTFLIDVATDNTTAGGFLSANFMYDAVELFRGT